MINYLEFTTAAMQKDMAIKQEYIEATFNMFDQDHDNYVSVDELKSIFRGTLDPNESTIEEQNMEH